MSLHRSERKRRRRQDAAKTRARNRIRKPRQRARRDAWVLEKIKNGNLPYAPTVMSWLSSKLEKKAARITPEDVKTLFA